MSSGPTIPEFVASPLYEEAVRLLRPHEGLAWMAIHTRPRAEKVVARRLDLLDVPYYLPLRPSIRRYKRKVVTFQIPLLTSYVFAALDPESRLAVLRTQRVVRTILVDDEELFLHELRQIHVASRVAEDLSVTDYDPTGRRVRILTGPLAGVEGLVRERRSRRILVLNITLLQRSVQVDIDLTNTKLWFLDSVR